VDSKAECDQLNLAHKSFYILFYGCSCLIQILDRNNIGCQVSL